jgi:hypothetical protein
VTDPVIETLDGDGASLSWRPAPWDDRALGVPTVEITALSGSPVLPALLARFDALCAARGTGLATVRIAAADRVAKRDLQAAGWQYVETSHPLRLAPIPADLAALGPIGRRRVPVELATIADLPALQAIAIAAFDHSRYHEDLRIHPARAQARHAAWIADTFARGDECLVHRDRAGEVVALMTYRRRDDAAMLFLGGTRPGAELYAPMFWVGVIADLRERGVRAIDTRVSAANLGAMRLHLALGFSAHGCDLGFNKLYPNGASLGSAP